MHVIAVPIELHVWIISHYYTSSLPTTNYSDQRSIRPTDNNKSTTTAEATVALHLQKTNTKHNNGRPSARMWVAQLSFNIHGMYLILYIGLFYLNVPTIHYGARRRACGKNYLKSSALHTTTTQLNYMISVY